LTLDEKDITLTFEVKDHFEIAEKLQSENVEVDGTPMCLLVFPGFLFFPFSVFIIKGGTKKRTSSSFLFSFLSQLHA
jgi:hypothetical protein